MTIRGLLFTLPALLCGWIAVLAGVGLMSDDAPARLVLFPSQDLIANLPDEVSLVKSSPWALTLASSEPDFAQLLYSKGAMLVLPAGLAGCIGAPLRK